MKTRSIFLTILFSIGLFYVACGQSPEKAPGKAAASAEKKSADQKKTVRIKHLAGEILAVDSRTKTIVMRSRDREVELIFDDSTVVKMDLDSVKPSEIPLGTRATVKYVERKGHFVARGIFVSTETAEKKESAPQSSYRNTA